MLAGCNCRVERGKWEAGGRPKHFFAQVCIVRGGALVDASAQTYWTGAQEKRNRTLGQTLSFLLNPLKESAESVFEVEVKDREIRSCFSTLLSYRCNVPEVKGMFAARCGAGRWQSCVSCHSTYEDMLRGRKNSSRVMAETTGRIRKVVEKQVEALSLGGRSLCTKRREAHSEVVALLSQRTLAPRPLILKSICGSDRVVAEKLCSTSTFELLRTLQLEVKRLLKRYLVRCLPSDEIYSHPEGPDEKWKRSSLMRLPLLKACNALMSHIAERYPVLGLHVSIAKREQRAQLKCSFTKDGLRRMIEERKYSAVDTLFLFAALFVGGSHSFEEGCDLTRIIRFYTEIVNKLLFYHMEERGRRESWRLCRRRFGGSGLLLREDLRRTAHLV